MSAPQSETLEVDCPGCGARFRVGAALAGKRGRCARCGQAFTVPQSTITATAGISQPQPAAQSSPPPAPEYIGFSCRLCDTRMFARPDKIGTSMKCPDCHAVTVVPPPESRPAKRTPAAMEGEQYELWDVDAAPLPSQLIAAQPTIITIECRMCQSLMYATEDQVGQTLKCGDCGTSHVVPPAPREHARFALVPDAEGFVLDPRADPGERPTLPPPTTRGMLYEQEEEAERRRRAARGDRGPQYDRRGRPILPRWPLLADILPFLFTSAAVIRWLTLSGGLLLSAAAGLGGIAIAFVNPIAGMCMLAFGTIIGTVCFAGAAAILVTVVTESSEGNHEIQRWPPPSVIEWLPDSFYVLIAAVVSTFPGWLVARFVLTEPWLIVAAGGASVLVCFPIVLLSQLDITSPFGVLSVRVLASFARCPFTWLMFYLETAALAALCAATIYAGNWLGYVAMLLIIPVGVAAMFVYARLLGRLGWVMAEKTPAIEPEPDQQTP